MDKRTPTLREGERYTLNITGCAGDGSGVGRVDGQVVFVKGALLGERCAAVIEHVGHTAAWGHMEELLEASPERVTPDCPYYDRCGGCQTRHMSYPEELRFKAAKVHDALERIGGLRVGDVPIHGAENVNFYRNKAQFPVAAGPKIGFYKERSHAVTDVERCLLQAPATQGVIAAVRGWMRTYSVPAYDERTGKGLVRHLYCRCAGEDTLVVLVVNGDAVPHEGELVEALRGVPGVRGVLLNTNTRDTNVVLGGRTRTLWGEDSLDAVLCGLTFRVSPASFFQVNWAQAQVLYALAGDFAALTGHETVADLYCGTGTIGLTLAGKAKKVYGAEIVPEAVEDARENARRNGLSDKTEFFCADSGDFAKKLNADGVKIDVLVVDPPRKGLSPDTVEHILEMAPRRLVYVSCDPATLARDLKRLTQVYALRRVEAVDLFPRTAHVETVVLLSKLKSTQQTIEVSVDLDELDLASAESKATYEELKDYVLSTTGLHVSSLYISQVKRKLGLEVGQNYNLPKSESSRQPKCPPEKEKAITDALRHFGMVQ